MVLREDKEVLWILETMECLGMDKVARETLV